MAGLLLKLLRVVVFAAVGLAGTLALVVLVYDIKQEWSARQDDDKRLKQATEFIDDFEPASTLQPLINSGKTKLIESINKLEDETQRSAREFQKKGVDGLDKRLEWLQRVIEQIEKELENLKATPAAPAFGLKDVTSPQRAAEREAKRLVDRAVGISMHEAEIEVRNGESTYLRSIREQIVAIDSIRQKELTCTQLRDALIEFRKLAEPLLVQKKRAKLQPDALTRAQRQALNEKLAQLDARAPQIVRDAEEYKGCRKRGADKQAMLDAIDERTHGMLDPTHTQRAEDRMRDALSGLGNQLTIGLQSWKADLEGERGSHWLVKYVYTPVNKVLLPVVAVFLAFCLIPPFLKLTSFYVVAPLATAQAPLRVMPTAAGTEQSGATSSVSQRINLEPGSELLIHPEYLQALPDRCSTSPKLVLNGRCLKASLMAGMYGLTQVRANDPAFISVSAGHESLHELAVIEMPDGSAFSVIPIHLVGVVQRQDRPMILSRHWQLNKLQSWLRWRWRYLVLHGPAKVIVKGCRGIQIESADDGRSLEDAATIGFSANLACSTSRTGDPLAYLSGKKTLLRARFSGSPGIFAYEETPDPAKRSGVISWLTGFGDRAVDLILKLVGL